MNMEPRDVALLAVMKMQEELLKSYVASQIMVFTLRAEVDALKTILCPDPEMEERLRQQIELDSKKYEPALRIVDDFFERWQANLLLQRKSLSTLVQ
jgi:hypothetical protein